MSHVKISVFGSDFGSEEVSAAVRTIESQWTGTGSEVAAFESELSARYGRTATLVDSGSSALMLAVRLLDLPRGSEIVVPSLTWVACAHAVRLAGHIPVFCDVDSATGNATAETIAPQVSSRTGAVMLVHYAGKPADVRAAQELGFPVIEDAAHAIDSSIDGSRCGSLGDIAILSFDPVKNLATCESGAILSSVEHGLIAKNLRYSGVAKSGFSSAASGAGSTARWWEHEIVEAYPKVVSNDVAASIGRVQLTRLETLQDKRRNIWVEYQSAFRELGWMETPLEVPTNETHSYFTYLVQFNSDTIRDAMAHHLLSKGIYTTFRFQPLHLTAFYRTEQVLPGCERLNEIGLNLPLHPHMTPDDVQTVIEAVCDFGAHRLQTLR